MKNKQEIFIEKANKAHYNKYDYSLVKYKNAKTKVEIICNLHGSFFQKPNNHLSGTKCPKCSKRYKINKDEFITQANKVHNYKYYYDKIKYLNKTTKIQILCNQHGFFNQTPRKHLSGQGCPKCAGHSITTNDFIMLAKKMHNNKYSYDKSKYLGAVKPIIINCKIHGYFTQEARVHLNGSGCPKCAKNIKLTTKEFIKRANLIYKNKYDYSLSKYTGSDNELIIICKEHGEFKKTPYQHIQCKCSCPKCNGTYRSNITEFIKKANIIHNNKYDYSLSVYKNVDTKLIINCHNHDTVYQFKQTPYKHIKKQRGCPKCKNIISKPETKWLDELGIKTEFRQISLPGLNKRIKVDGYEPCTNTVYEFYGDFWHGNPNIYKSNEHHPIIKKTFGNIYYNTIQRECAIRKAGYNLITIWESEFIKNI